MPDAVSTRSGCPERADADPATGAGHLTAAVRQFNRRSGQSTRLLRTG
jgi:hypothetical protein